jgi:two-component system response regulator GlrR
MPDGDGFAVMREARALAPRTAVILLTAFGSVPDAVTAMRNGACDYLVKPVSFEQLEQAAQEILARSQAIDGEPGQLLGHSPALLRTLDRARQVAGIDADILIQAESGTGKELLARAIHEASPRRNKPFVSVNCSAMAENLLESELFGHDKGAFSGATRAQKGLFESSDGGTLLLDEVADMPMRLQVKLLRVLQENAIRPVGSAEAVQTNVRIISATHRDLHELMVAGQFREDLYYRLNVVHIEVPSLGRRREDIPLLVAHFLESIAKETGQRKIYAPEAVELLATAEWPGNIRQLYNVVRQNVALSHGAIITAELVQHSLGGNPTRLPSFDEARDEFTRNYLSQILQITAGNVSQAARLAKRNRTDFYKLLSRHQLLPDDFKKS